jgi:hypothetical protein
MNKHTQLVGRVLEPPTTKGGGGEKKKVTPKV